MNKLIIKIDELIVKLNDTRNKTGNETNKIMYRTDNSKLISNKVSDIDNRRSPIITLKFTNR